MNKIDKTTLQNLLVTLIDEVIEENTRESQSIVDCSRFIVEYLGDSYFVDCPNCQARFLKIT